MKLLLSLTKVDARVQTFENHFVKEATKFVRDFKSLAKEANESLDKITVLDKENERLLRAVVSQNIMSIVQSPSVVESFNLQTELEHTKERINPLKNSKEDKLFPNKQVKASVRSKPITVSQPHVITKKDVNSDSNGLSSTREESTAKTRRPQLRSNTKNDKVHSASKSSCIKNKDVEVEEHHRNLLLSKNKKHMSSECNSIQLAFRNDKCEVLCAMCMKCLVTANHDVYVLNYVNGMNSCDNNQSVNVLNIANEKKHRANVKKSKKLGSKERLASPRPSKPRTYLRWLPTGRFFDLNGNLIISSDSECKSDTSLNDTTSASNPQEPKAKGFYILLLFFAGTIHFGNDHVAVILDLEIAFRRNTCFVKNLEGVDLVKGNHSTNLYTINLYEMSFASPICLIARATSTKIHNQVLKEYYDSVGISHQTLSVRTLQQNGVVERRNRTLVEAVQTMALCYPKNDCEDIGKLGAKGDINFFIGYSANFCSYKVYNQRAKKIMETMNVTFHELLVIAFKQRSSKPGLQGMNFLDISVKDSLLHMFPMYDDYIGSQRSAAPRTAPTAPAPQVLQTLTATTTTINTTLTPIISSSQASDIPNTS
ncbi:retrovirus-related pol polyprotein from transposon TNT 1-94 [Tanacetum coccineum]